MATNNLRKYKDFAKLVACFFGLVLVGFVGTFMLAEGLRSGVLAARGADATLIGSPGKFWFHFAVYAIGVAGMFAGAIFTGYITIKLHREGTLFSEDRVQRLRRTIAPIEDPSKSARMGD